jgi:hypothetical protein
MSDRIKHSVLLNMESEAKPWSDAAMLIAEVRRLRELIAAIQPSGKPWCPGCSTTGSMFEGHSAVVHAEGCWWPTLFAEARAIREEKP